MKQNDILLYAGLGLAAYFLFIKKSATAPATSPAVSVIPGTTPKLTTLPAASTNTTASLITSGASVLNNFVDRLLAPVPAVQYAPQQMPQTTPTIVTPPAGSFIQSSDPIQAYVTPALNYDNSGQLDTSGSPTALDSMFQNGDYPGAETIAGSLKDEIYCK